MTEHIVTPPTPVMGHEYQGKPCRILQFTPHDYALVQFEDGQKAVRHTSDLKRREVRT